MARSDHGAAGYDFLDRHAEVIERLVPAVRAVAFFDTRGRPLRGRGPILLSQVRLQVRSVLKSTAIGSGRRPLNAILPVTASERAAAFVLYAGSGTRGAHRTPPPAVGVCLIVFDVAAGTDPPPLETLQAQLEPALACVGDHLARYTNGTAQASSAVQGLRDLEWLFEVTEPAAPRGGSRDPSDRGERLARLVVASVAHLECVLGALVVPERHLRIVRTAEAAYGTEDVLRHLEPPVLSWVQNKNRPMVVNKTTTWNPGTASREASLAVRLLAVPVNSSHASGPAGALMLLRPADAPEFTRRHLSLVKHLGRHVGRWLEADFDVLTGLRTRASAQSQVLSWERVTPRPQGPHSVIFLGIDRLGIVNDTKGFDAGDALMVRVAQLLAGPHLPPDAVAAHISSDKFALVLPHMDAGAAADLARVLQTAAAQLPLDRPAAGDEPVSLSCGIACFTDAREFPSALALAHLACRTAKDHGRGCVEIYHDDDDSMIRRQSDSIAVIRLREALHNDDFTLVAQRIMPLQSQGDSEGFELLLRVDDADHAPADLLSAAHRSQLAPALDLWVVEHAIVGAAPHRSALLAANASLSINITGPSLADVTFLERVERLIRRSRIAPSLLTFEITETIAVLNVTKALKFVQELRTMGCRFALDDFGTGTNSLKNLTNLPVNYIKIDGSFVTDILSNPQSVAMIRAIVSLAKDLGIGTVAEYAENVRIIERLRELGVQYAQGYGVEKPRAFKEVLNELSARESQMNAALGREI